MQILVSKSLKMSCAVYIIALIPFVDAAQAQISDSGAPKTPAAVSSEKPKSEIQLEEIVVTGVRGSLTKSIRTKRDSGVCAGFDQRHRARAVSG